MLLLCRDTKVHYGCCVPLIVHYSDTNSSQRHCGIHKCARYSPVSCVYTKREHSQQVRLCCECCEIWIYLACDGVFPSLFTVPGDQLCELNCRAIGYRFYVRQSDQVIDGTPCGQNQTAICVAGTCQVGEYMDVTYC